MLLLQFFAYVFRLHYQFSTCYCNWWQHCNSSVYSKIFIVSNSGTLLASSFWQRNSNTPHRFEMSCVTNPCLSSWSLDRNYLTSFLFQFNLVQILYIFCLLCFKQFCQSDLVNNVNLHFLPLTQWPWPELPHANCCYFLWSECQSSAQILVRFILTQFPPL